MSVSLPFVSQAGRFFSFGISVTALVGGCCLFSAGIFSSVPFLTLLAAKGFRRPAIDVGFAIVLLCLSGLDAPLDWVFVLDVTDVGLFMLVIVGLAVLLLSLARETRESWFGEDDNFLFMLGFGGFVA
jgi:hypothetical protein